MRALTLILSFLILGPWAGTLAAGETAATLTAVTGKGRIVLAGGLSGEFKIGTVLKAGSRIVTEEGAQAMLLMADGSRVAVGPNTDLTLSESKEDNGTRSTVFDMVRGLFRATVQKLTVGSRFDVRTSNAVASVKGTDFEVEADDKGSEARVKEGTVWLQDGKGETAVVKAGKAARCECGPDKGSHRLSEPRDLSPKEVGHFVEWAQTSVSPHSGERGAIDKAKQARWDSLRPDQKRKVFNDLTESLGDTWTDIISLSAEERQERWRDRLHNADERRLAAEGAKVDFALGKCAIDRQGRRVRFDEFVVRPAANQMQFLNYTRRGDRVDLISTINTYNRAIPSNLSDAPGMNQRIWRQGLLNPPQYYVVTNDLVAGNSSGDSFATSLDFYDPYFRAGLALWELPVKQMDIRLNVPDLQAPRVGGELVEHWTRQYNGLASPVVAGTHVALTGQLANVASLRSIAGSTNNLPSYMQDGGSTTVATDINNTNLVWSSNAALPTTTLLGLGELEAQQGDAVFGFRRTYASGSTLEFRNYIINENGEIVNLTGITAENLMTEFVNRRLITSLKQIELRSNQFHESDGINVVSKMLFLFDIGKSQDSL